MIQKNFELSYNTFEAAFCGLNRLIIEYPEYTTTSRIGDMREITSINYEVIDPRSYKFENEKIGRLDYDYASTFYKWMISGSTDVKELVDRYPNVARFVEKPKSELLPENFNTFYGPRILQQLPSIKEELVTKENSRRAVISILEAEDLLLLDKNENLEFPCCDSATLHIRDGKLNIHVHMRSQNIGQVLKLDMYLWGRFVCELAEDLGVEIGKFRSSVVSAHVFERDIEYLQSIIN